jgi:hypothetical protein
MESNEFLEVPPPKIPRTDIPQESMQSLFSSEEIYKDEMNYDSEAPHDGNSDDELEGDDVAQLIRECTQLQLDISASFRNTQPFKANTTAANFEALSSQIKSTFEMSRIIISMLSFSLHKNKQNDIENKQLKEQLTGLQKRIDFLQDQNSRLLQQSNNIVKKTTEIFEHSRNHNVDLPAKTYLASASSNVPFRPPSAPMPPPTSFSPPQPHQSTSVPPPFPPPIQRPSPPISLPRINLFPVQIRTVASYQSIEELRAKLLRRFASDNNLPITRNVVPVKSFSSNTDSNFSCNDFKLIFTSHEDRAEWIAAMKLNLHFFQLFEPTGISTKIVLHGLPASYSSKDSETLAKVLNFNPAHFRILFANETKCQLAQTCSITCAVHHDLRRKLHAQKDRVIDVENNLYIEISDFHQPVQCKKCYIFGHTTKNCRSEATCFQCHSINCRIDQNKPCPHTHCINCGGIHHSRNRRICPEYIRLINESKNLLEQILHDPPAVD